MEKMVKDEWQFLAKTTEQTVVSSLKQAVVF